jgi:hypothetical protein
VAARLCAYGQVCLDAGGFRLDHRWRLDADWRAHSITVERGTLKVMASSASRVPAPTGG